VRHVRVAEAVRLRTPESAQADDAGSRRGEVRRVERPEGTLRGIRDGAPRTWALGDDAEGRMMIEQPFMPRGDGSVDAKLRLEEAEAILHVAGDLLHELGDVED